ncbi:AraC family transcriptional regulator [Rhodocytophaga rosea]|uniref:AraC family transcriptional regulator n=1 Tax=Rhodocytophaga rosea TaxID=2704465 RepID=A0A6C0GMY7_9BACT|nr:helix-turn-helix domain-containing protein [Rhodocytophaga rosea]QHT69396.1 AraC family transcriptional regulator [Rhodocytophaga rosea]
MERTANIYYPKTSPENIFIRQIWSTKDIQPDKRTEKILPKGTAEIIFNLSEGIHCYKTDEKNAFYLPKYFINGINLNPINLSISRQYFIGIQFNIFALKYIFKIPTVEFNDQVLEGSLVCKSLDRLAEKLSESSSFHEQAEIILQWFKGKIKDCPGLETKNRIIHLHADPDIIHLSPKTIGEKYNITPRHLSRLCVEYLGMCTEDVILYRKYLSSLYQIHHPHQSLTQITYDCGYYDQSHFVRTFKLFTGLTPKQYRKVASGLPGHIFEVSAEKAITLHSTKSQLQILLV